MPVRQKPSQVGLLPQAVFLVQGAPSSRGLAAFRKTLIRRCSGPVKFQLFAGVWGRLLS